MHLIFTDMKSSFFLLSFLFFALSSFSQQNPDTLQKSGREYMRVGDWGNAILVFKRALQLKPEDVSILNDIAYTFYLQRDFVRALETIRPVIEKSDATVQSFQIAGTVYRSIEAVKEGARVYAKGLKKFPGSGVLYSEYGELLWQKKDYNAIAQWEKGIALDPNYPGNYYHASRFYYFSTDRVWGLIYGEIFTNLESYTVRTAEIKNILFDGYKKLFSETEIPQHKKRKKKNGFASSFLNLMDAQSSLAAKGITPETLLKIRRNFLNEWFSNYAQTYPFRLFDYQKQLLEAGMFDAYNQWLFGSAIQPADYQAWIQKNREGYDTFNHFQRGRVFKLPQGQYYQNR